MLRTILVALDESSWSEAATALALEWAARFGARLIGLGILDKPSIMGRFEPVPLGAGSFKKQADVARLVNAQKHVQHCVSRFSERCLAAGIASDALQDVGDPAECILRNAHRCDVIILGGETHFHFETPDHPDSTLPQVFRRSSRPIVAVPKEPSTGTGVVVAYGGGREVARTLQTFQLLGLAGGETIHLVNVRSGDHKTEVFVELAAEFLKSHRAAYEVHYVQSDLQPAQVLLDQVRNLQPRLMVMGAQGHHPLRDLFATSVTRAVLRASPVPVLIGA